MKKNENRAKNVKTDLKHDTMEYAEPLEGEDESESDNAVFVDNEEEDISEKELTMLQQDNTDNQAYALDSAETDRLEDEDILPEEDWVEDLPDDDSENKISKEHHRK